MERPFAYYLLAGMALLHGLGAVAAFVKSIPGRYPENHWDVLGLAWSGGLLGTAALLAGGAAAVRLLDDMAPLLQALVHEVQNARHEARQRGHVQSPQHPL